MAVFNEDTRVKIPATIQYLRLGYHYQSLKTDDIDIDFNTKILSPLWRRLMAENFVMMKLRRSL